MPDKSPKTPNRSWSDWSIVHGAQIVPDKSPPQTVADISQRCEALRRHLCDPECSTDVFSQESYSLGAIPDLNELWAAMRRLGGPVPHMPDCLAWDEARLRARRVHLLRGNTPDHPIYQEVLKALDEVATWCAQAGKPARITQVSHSEDYRSVCWYGMPYSFTATQAACVKALWEAWEQGAPELSQLTILEKAGSTCDRLRDVFDKGNHSAWKEMIIEGETKGSFRLAGQTA